MLANEGACLRAECEKLAAGDGGGDDGDDKDETEDEDLEGELGYFSLLETVIAYLAFKNPL
ncbi:hypothetical protein GYMLUDRAFT_74511 [Collybiopsis luxurians FD-317 M1]|uniref:Uncharacterized protein n=1 Tax=Collybiopsis luxurians FD-317 M1 TaxID=944289 RepID=A0A0D0B6Y5_9AGAR|nr:hypothetical protein GYMLUDRAFT_74511 [Collybiopsis luxurians FD-317 M1]